MDDELISEFINESREHLATIETDLLSIEEAGENIDENLVNKVFRAAHSIKGGSAFFGLTNVKELAHKAETVLDMLRSKKMVPNAEITNVLLSAFDQLREMINNPALRETADISELVVALTGLASSYLPQEKKASLTTNVELHPKGETTTITLPQVDLERTHRSGQYVYCAELDLIHDLDQQGKNVLAVFRDIWETGEILDCLFDFDAVGTLDGPVGHQLPLRLIFATVIQPDDVGILVPVKKEKVKLLMDPGKPIPSGLVSSTVASSAPPVVTTDVSMPAPEPIEKPTPPKEVAVSAPNVKSLKSDSASSSEVSTVSATAESTLRVNMTLLETLMNLAGELVLSRNQLRTAIALNDVPSLAVSGQRINQVTSELQDAIMQTRLQPIGNVFGKFPRVVRDMCNALHKEIQLDIQGRDVAMDKSLIEGISDPLTHMVRNAADHGIEMPQDRVKAGKKAQGTVRIEAKHEAGQVVVEVADDGKGLDPNRIAKSAVSKGLITAEKVKTLSEQDKMALIFLPGLSTAEKVTDISGRGVGMDVVKTNLDRLGGKVEIKSEVGKGTVFRIKLPLTLAIIPSLIVSIGKERFAVPQVNVEELLRIRLEEVKKRTEVVGGAEVLLLRDRIIPLLRFSEMLHANRRSDTEQGALEIVVVTTGVMSYALVVEAFHDTEEIVVKPLGRHLKGLREYAGATILGDGTVALILDVAGLAGKAGLSAVSTSIAAREQEEREALGQSAEAHAMLLFHNAPEEVCAAPLDAVLRIERIKPEQVENAGGRRTVKYRGAALPLVTLSDAAQVKPLGDAKDLAVIVTSVRGREVGLLGAMPVDVVETTSVIDLQTHRQRGISGSTIIQNQTVLIADLFELVDAVYPDWSTNLPALQNVTESRSLDGACAPAVLLAEDSDFFRAQVKRYLQEDGHLVFDAPDGESAWELLLAHVDVIKTVVTDIEMPRVNGLELAQRIRGDSRSATIPIIALTSLASEEDMAKGKAAGIDHYLVKLDRDGLLAQVRECIASATAANVNES